MAQKKQKVAVVTKVTTVAEVHIRYLAFLLCFCLSVHHLILLTTCACACRALSLNNNNGIYNNNNNNNNNNKGPTQQRTVQHQQSRRQTDNNNPASFVSMTRMEAMERILHQTAAVTAAGLVLPVVAGPSSSWSSSATASDESSFVLPYDVTNTASSPKNGAEENGGRMPSSSSSSLSWIPPFTRESLEEMYFPNMCELNTWLVCQKLLEEGNSNQKMEAFAVVVASPFSKQDGGAAADGAGGATAAMTDTSIPIWHQKGGIHYMNEDGFKEWDFHVFAMVREKKRESNTRSSSNYILDLDSTLGGWPCPAQTWVQRSLRPGAIAATTTTTTIRRHFRVISAKEYIANMHSSRTGIAGKQQESNLMESFVTMDPTKGYGKVMDEDEFIRFIV